MPAERLSQFVQFDSFAPFDNVERTNPLLVDSDSVLIGLAIALGARETPGWSPPEEAVSRDCKAPSKATIDHARRLILCGRDPLGDLFCKIHSPDERRRTGATYTPHPIVETMLEWAGRQGAPERIVDPGTGSGRYLVLSGKHFKEAKLVGIEAEPIPALLARANLAVHGLSHKSTIILGDYRSVNLPVIEGRTLYIGNPPYIRHHLLDPRWKDWLINESRSNGFNASQLAGLHVHFILRTALNAAKQDFGAFITAAEWLDVNYGQLVRELFLGPLGGKRIVVVEPTANPFPDAATTAAIIYFEIGSQPKSIRLKRVKDLRELRDENAYRAVRRERLETESRWSHLTHGGRDVPSDFIELGELCRVHRGQVTGFNKVWIAGPHARNLPESVLYPSVTRAKELFNVGKVLDDLSTLRCVVDLPVDLDSFAGPERQAIDHFLAYARNEGAHQGYVATNRRAWWSVRLRQPAPILATYMARRPPAFVRNLAGARHINIAHGLYPREAMSESVLSALASFLSKMTSIVDGRTYAGGLTKFEPREMERLLVPQPAILLQGYPS